jgi:hypothetical protein
MEKNVPTSSSIDVARYTEMEIAHGHDTANEIEIVRSGKVTPSLVGEFIQANDNKHAGI